MTQFSILITLMAIALTAISSVKAIPTVACPETCKMIYHPLCVVLPSNELMTFGNACMLQMYKCKHPKDQLTIVSNSTCENITIDKSDVAPHCDAECSAVFEPVCAHSKNGNTRTFSNACELDNYNCRYPRDNFAIFTNSSCENAPAPAPKCDFACLTVDDPVCAIIKDGGKRTFSNSCQLQLYNCLRPNDQAFLVDNSACSPPEIACDIDCKEIGGPVCAISKNGRTHTFNNSCLLAIYNCENPTTQFKLVSNTVCPPVKCNRDCGEIYKPVCAMLQSGEFKTFSNACELNNYNCEHSNERAKWIANAECSPATTNPLEKRHIEVSPRVCPESCPNIYKPVYARFESGESQTFDNLCELGIFRCQNPLVIFILTNYGQRE
ncbi:hypothetical protein FBU30_001738 [Linnemannia zychae]|nr:hypothetical protein FBU30_001738 [Linnemannia zychae]